MSPCGCRGGGEQCGVHAVTTSWREALVPASRLAEVEQELRIARFDADMARGECDMAIAAATMELRGRAERAEAALREIVDRLSTTTECMRVYVFMRDAETPARPGWLEEEIAANDRLLASVPSSLDAPTCANCMGEGKVLHYGAGDYAELRACSVCGDGRHLAETTIPNVLDAPKEQSDG